MPKQVTIRIQCDVCGSEPAKEMPSWFEIQRSLEPAGGGLAREVPDKVSWRGWARFAMFVCLCDAHRDAIVAAVESMIVEARRPVAIRAGDGQEGADPRARSEP